MTELAENSSKGTKWKTIIKDNNNGLTGSFYNLGINRAIIIV